MHSRKLQCHIFPTTSHVKVKIVFNIFCFENVTLDFLAEAERSTERGILPPHRRPVHGQEDDEQRYDSDGDLQSWLRQHDEQLTLQLLQQTKRPLG
jgi:hypothetical protein